MKTPHETLRHHVTGAIERGEEEAITEIPATPAPVWRLLEPGEIIREGDEYFCPILKEWRNSRGYLGESTNYGTHMPVRRRMEPDPVKAELLDALKGVTYCLAWHVEDRQEGVAMDAKYLAEARAAIARAKATT